MGLRELGVGAADVGARELALELGFEGWPRRKLPPLISPQGYLSPYPSGTSVVRLAPSPRTQSSPCSASGQATADLHGGKKHSLEGWGRCWGKPLPSQPKALWGICCPPPRGQGRELFSTRPTLSVPRTPPQGLQEVARLGTWRVELV